MPDDKTDKPQPGTTEVLIKALETFGECEPTALIVLWTDQSGCLCWTADPQLTNTQALGIVEAVRALILRRIVGT